MSLRKFTPGLLPGFLPPVGWRADSGSREDGAPSHRWGRTGRRGCLTPRAGHRDAHGPPARLPTTERSCFLRCALKQLPKLSERARWASKDSRSALWLCRIYKKTVVPSHPQPPSFPAEKPHCGACPDGKAMHHSIIWPFSSSVASFLECRGHDNRNHSGFHFEELFTGTRAPFTHSSPWSASLWSAQGHTQCQQWSPEENSNRCDLSPASHGRHAGLQMDARVSQGTFSSERGGKVMSCWLKAVQRVY